MEIIITIKIKVTKLKKEIYIFFNIFKDFYIL